MYTHVRMWYVAQVRRQRVYEAAGEAEGVGVVRDVLSPVVRLFLCCSWRLWCVHGAQHALCFIFVYLCTCDVGAYVQPGCM